MILTLLLLASLGCALYVILGTNWVNGITDFWIVLLALLAGFIIGIIILLLYIYILSLTVNKKKPNEECKKIYIRTMQRVCELLLMLFGGKVYIRGMDKIPTDKKFMFACNHQSWFDAIVALWTLRGFPVSYVLKKSLNDAFVLGKYIHAVSFISLDRENPREGVKAINRAVKKIEDDKASIFIFPEGTRSGGYEMGEFHSGSFKIATKAKCPIVLCALQNSWKVTKRFPFRSTNVYFDVVEVIDYEDYKDKSTQEISDYAHKVIKESLDQLPKY